MSKEKWREKTEKIWKLLKLLNEYETPRSWEVYKSYDDYDWFFYWVDCDWETEIVWSDSLICSKKFWFIKWLVENEKINFKKFDGDNCDYLENPIWSNNYDECDYLDLIQWLAISDAPIDDLIYYLK